MHIVRDITPNQKAHIEKLLKSHVFDLERSTWETLYPDYTIDEAAALIDFLQAEIKNRKAKEEYEKVKSEFWEIVAKYAIPLNDLYGANFFVALIQDDTLTSKQFKKLKKDLVQNLADNNFNL